MKKSYFYYTILLTIFCLLSANGFAQDRKEKKKRYTYSFCERNNNYYSRGKRNFSAKDLREFTIPAGGLLEVDGRKNGGISIKGENRSDILVRACVRAWAESEADAIAAVNNTRIETSGVIRSNQDGNDYKHSVSYQILVPNQTDLKLQAYNGGISIKDVAGTLEFKTLNGGIKLQGISGDVKGRTTNGGVKVILSGSSFNGGLDVETTNGGVKMVLPKTFAADIETGTVNGGFKSDFPELSYKKEKGNRWYRPKRVSASLNGGGAKIRVITTNGGVKISSAEE